MDTRGPWRLTRPELTNQATIPCQACHSVHREGALQARPADRISVAGAAVRDSVALYDRREEMHFAVGSLAIPVLYDAARPAKISPDRRQGICYQCHAPRQPEANSAAAANHWGPQAGSGDDRTPMGVHEGISCLACHGGHNESARASCATCHPAMSHCGIDVEKMDTTFASKASGHDIAGQVHRLPPARPATGEDEDGAGRGESLIEPKSQNRDLGRPHRPWLAGIRLGLGFQLKTGRAFAFPPFRQKKTERMGHGRSRCTEGRAGQETLRAVRCARTVSS